MNVQHPGNCKTHDVHCAQACRRQAPAWLVSALLSVYPEAANCTTQFGELPLHVAVGSGAAPEVVNLIVLANWEGIVARDKSGRTPIEIWDECELLVDEDHRVVFECLTRCHNTYTRMQDEWQTKFNNLKKEHEAALRALNMRHDDAMHKEAKKKAELESELNKLNQSVEMLTNENAEQNERITSFSKVEHSWRERVDYLTKSVERLQSEKAEEQENVEALHQLIEDKDDQIKSLSSKVRKLTKDMQHVMSWYDQTDSELSRTQESLQRMVDNYVEVHEKLSHERDTLKSILVKRGIEALPRKPTIERSIPSAMSEDYYNEEGYSIMNDAANAAAAAARAALTVIADPVD
jgi:predicted  nucleic acid-binding Zn-ribbon protein